MQGDIFQLEQLTSQMAVPKPQPAAVASARPQNGQEVSIYNEDDLSHLLYVSNKQHHHHHRHHHHQRPQPFVHPADNGTVLVNEMEYNTPDLSDCESCDGSDSGTDMEDPLTPPTELDETALEAYRRKGRRNALGPDYGFPVFLGRQDEEWQAPEVLTPTAVPQTIPAAPAQKAEEIPASGHVDVTKGPLMSWWPQRLETMRNDWAIENLEWKLAIEKEKLKERERESGVVLSGTKKPYDGDYSTRHVANVEGCMMNWWPAPLDTLEHEWSERFYE
ncbi:hypothetical protein F4808DRAFT_174646 [Astrocystis sublimbata]|nr:hypothetical protein F4808DRAFT_174646 [Astrocystis sublimbata]